MDEVADEDAPVATGGWWFMDDDASLTRPLLSLFFGNSVFVIVVALGFNETIRQQIMLP